MVDQRKNQSSSVVVLLVAVCVEGSVVDLEGVEDMAVAGASGTVRCLCFEFCV